MKNINLLGQRFGKLVAKSPAGISSRGQRLWHCECDCGNTTEVEARVLRRKKGTRSCGCIRIERAKNLTLLPPGEAAATELFNNYRFVAKSRNLCFELTKDYFRSLTDSPCDYCGRLPSQVRIVVRKNGAHVYNGVDRIDNSVGYAVGNCVPCCKICNWMKGTKTRDEFLQACHAVVAHSEKHNGKEISSKSNQTPGPIDSRSCCGRSQQVANGREVVAFQRS